MYLQDIPLKVKKAGLLTILVLQAFPSFMGLIAMYVLFWKFGLLGQPLYLTILYIGGAIPGNLWLIKGFLSQIPRDLDESAMIDGASKLKIFIHIILPLSVPILTFVAVSMFMAPWMDYMLPGYLLNVPAPGNSLDKVQEQWTLAVGIFSFINGQYDLNYPGICCCSINCWGSNRRNLHGIPKIFNRRYHGRCNERIIILAKTNFS